MNTYDAEFIDHEINDLIEDENELKNIKKINKGLKKVRKYLQKTKKLVQYGIEWQGF